MKLYVLMVSHFNIDNVFCLLGLGLGYAAIFFL